MEALLLNSSAVYLKWKAPPIGSINGELYYGTFNLLNTKGMRGNHTIFGQTFLV